MTLETVFCTQCGARNPGAARFCDQCGAMLVKPVAPAASAVTQAAPQTTVSVPIAATPPVAAAPAPASGAVICSQCGIAALPGEAFCDNCGAALGAPTVLTQQPIYPPPQPAPLQTADSRQQTADSRQQTVDGRQQTADSRLKPTPMQPTQPAQPTPMQPTQPAQPTPMQPAPLPQPAPIPVATRSTLAPARLQVEGSGASLALPATAAALVGRADPASNFYPDLDLTPYNALEHGVGRRHLRLAVSGGQISVEDLDSTNGTAVNGKKLSPHQPQPLADGDLLLVGRLALRVML